MALKGTRRGAHTLGQLRGRMTELDSAKNIVVFCAIGVRAYNAAARILMQERFTGKRPSTQAVPNFQSAHYKEFIMEAALFLPWRLRRIRRKSAIRLGYSGLRIAPPDNEGSEGP